MHGRFDPDEYRKQLEIVRVYNERLTGLKLDVSGTGRRKGPFTLTINRVNRKELDALIKLLLKAGEDGTWP